MQPKEPGARHDFSIYKQNVNKYSSYLKITKGDIEKDSTLDGTDYWDLLADKG